MANISSVLGKKITVTVDRPLGSTHPKFSDIIYPVNYGFVKDILAGDGQEQDVYLLGVNYPVQTYQGIVIAILHRLDDKEDKWVAAPEGMTFSKEEIQKLTFFQEQFFRIEIFC